MIHSVCAYLDSSTINILCERVCVCVCAVRCIEKLHQRRNYAHHYAHCTCTAKTRWCPVSRCRLSSSMRYDARQCLHSLLLFYSSSVGFIAVEFSFYYRLFIGMQIRQNNRAICSTTFSVEQFFFSSFSLSRHFSSSSSSATALSFQQTALSFGYLCRFEFIHFMPQSWCYLFG